LLNCIFTGNEVTDDGGAIYNRSVTIKLINCVFDKNKAGPGGVSRQGGAIRNKNTNIDITNCTFYRNYADGSGGGIYFGNTFPAAISNSIFWENISNGSMDETAQICGGEPVVEYSCIQGLNAFAGNGNIDADPCFADPCNADYHLKSEVGRWSPNQCGSCGNWVQDCVSSPCIDAGDPASDFSDEPYPNGGVINMGAYGGTAQASKSPLGLCAKPEWGDANGDCVIDILDFAIMSQHWLEY